MDNEEIKEPERHALYHCLSDKVDKMVALSTEIATINKSYNDFILAAKRDEDVKDQQVVDIVNALKPIQKELQQLVVRPLMDVQVTEILIKMLNDVSKLIYTNTKKC